MEATTDTVLNQVTNLLLSKIDKQNLDPDFLQKFMEGLLGKLSFKTSKVIKQTSTQTEKEPKQTSSLVKDIKKAYKELLRDETYKNNYKNFLEYVLPKSLLDKKEDNTVADSFKTDIDTNSKDSNTISSAQIVNTNNEPTKPTNQQTDEGRVKLIDTPVEKQKVVFDGFSERGWNFFSERLPKILKPLMFKPTPEKQNQGGLGLLGGGIALLLGGLAALVTGLMTDGPFKGLLKILSKVGIEGGIKILQSAAKIFIGSLKNAIAAPTTLLKSAAKSIGKIFGKGAYKAILKPLKGLTGLFTRMLGGLVRFLTPLLKKIPLIGTVISWGFAYSRFKSGDVVGGVIDILSGIASIFPGVGTAIAIGLDVLNAFLDAKTGGATKETSQKKTGLLAEWALGLGKILYDGIKYIPVVGPLIQAIEDMTNGKWLDATYNLVRAIPGVGIIMDVLNWFTQGKLEQNTKTGISDIGKSIGDWLAWVRNNIWDKIAGFVTGVFDSVKDWWNNLSWDPQTWFGGEPEKPELPKQQTTKPPSTTEPPIPMATGGIVTEPINAIVGEAGPEAVVPLEKYFNPQDLSLSNTTLEQIAVNTKDTNSSLQVLSDALFRLITVLDKKMTQGNSTVINTQGQMSQQATPASIIANANVDPIRRVRMQFT